MSAITTNYGPDPIHFTVTPGDESRWVKVSYKIGTVLIEDLLRVPKINQYPTEATFETPIVDCTLTDAGVFECNGDIFDLPVYLVANEEGHVELKRYIND